MNDLTCLQYIELTRGQVALVDACDYEYLSRYKWHARWSPVTKSFYAARTFRKSEGHAPGRDTTMHRQVLSITDPKIQVDHIHHDTLDNRRSELRVVDNRTNCSNKKGKSAGKFTSKFVGVSWSADKKKWRASIRLGKLSKHLGRFDSEEEASDAYTKALEAYK